MVAINDRVWKSFILGDLFTIKRGNAKNIQNKINSGQISLISAIDSNNGVLKTTTAQNKETIYNNVYTINNNGNGVCLAYYHKYNLIASSDVSVLEPKYEELKNDNVARFITTMIQNQKSKYNYGYKMSNARMLRQAILLPVKDNGEIDYNFMSIYIKTKEDRLKKEYFRFAKEIILDLGEFVDIPDLDKKTWKAFSIDDIFSIESGKRLESYNMLSGLCPFIGATDSGNGITNFVSNMNNSLDSNVLGVNYNGNGMVISFYHQYKCLFSDDVKRFHLKKAFDNKFILLFMKTVILQQKSKYNYGYKFNAKRMARQKIILPIDSLENPDYDYMEQYIKNRMILLYQKYFVNTTKEK